MVAALLYKSYLYPPFILTARGAINATFIHCPVQLPFLPYLLHAAMEAGWVMLKIMMAG
jgi:hypothetical protein